MSQQLAPSIMSQQLAPKSAASNKSEISCDASTELKSTLFLKQMMALSISHIVYLRGIFGEAEFRDRYIGNMKIKMLRENKKDDNVHLLIEWMRGCFDALEKKFLKSVSLTIHNPDNPRDEPIESYTFSVNYQEDRSASVSMRRNGVDVTDSAYSEKGVKEASVNCLMELCSVIGVLDVLPEEVVLNMELAYYDERTPKDYEPRGFRPASNKARRDEETEVGVVETKFHRLRMKVYTRKYCIDDGEIRQKASETSHVSLDDKPQLPEARVSPIVRPDATRTSSAATSTATGRAGPGRSVVGRAAAAAAAAGKTDVTDMETSPPMMAAAPSVSTQSSGATVDYSRKGNSTWEGVEAAAPGGEATPCEETATAAPAGRRSSRKTKRNNRESPERNSESATSLKRRKK